MFGLFKKSPKPPTAFKIPDAFTTLLENSRVENRLVEGSYHHSKARIEWPENGAALLRLSCEADLWCRKRTSVTTMLDPSLFEIYTTGDDRIDEEWIVQTNPPSAFKAEFKEGCDALLALLQEDSGLHAHKGWLIFKPANTLVAERTFRYFSFMETLVRTAERELIKQD